MVPSMVIFSSSLAMHPHLNFISLADGATSGLLFVHSTHRESTELSARDPEGPTVGCEQHCTGENRRRKHPEQSELCRLEARLHQHLRDAAICAEQHGCQQRIDVAHRSADAGAVHRELVNRRDLHIGERRALEGGDVVLELRNA
jgi:hypothetical protein